MIASKKKPAGETEAVGRGRTEEGRKASGGRVGRLLPEQRQVAQDSDITKGEFTTNTVLKIHQLPVPVPSHRDEEIQMLVSKGSRALGWEGNYWLGYLQHHGRSQSHLLPDGPQGPDSLLLWPFASLASSPLSKDEQQPAGQFSLGWARRGNQAAYITR